MTERTRRTAIACGLLAGLASTGGCINFAANMIHAITGNNRPADFDGLEGRRVAVVCATDGGMGTDATSAMLTGYIHAALNGNVKKIDVIRQSEVERWIDSHGHTDADYLEVGRGVGAERLVAVEVLNLSLKDGATLYKGQADITVSVYDIPAGGKILYRKQIPEFAFPKLGGPTVTDVSEAKFRARFLSIVARTVSGLFYEVDATADFALDATAHTF
ncbi:MAG: hypothetical protein KDA45_12520 [Planctomycetales bacterium]|nr:hypothetical protein [Planctomycetales bacterium]